MQDAKELASDLMTRLRKPYLFGNMPILVGLEDEIATLIESVRAELHKEHATLHETLLSAAPHCLQARSAAAHIIRERDSLRVERDRLVEALQRSAWTPAQFTRLRALCASGMPIPLDLMDSLLAELRAALADKERLDRLIPKITYLSEKGNQLYLSSGGPACGATPREAVDAARGKEKPE
jgi:hypothetical protein